MKRGMKKQAQANIIALILLILLILAAIIILWNVVNPMVIKSGKDIEMQKRLLNIMLEIKEVKMYVPRNLTIEVYRGSGRENLSELKIIFYEKGGGNHIISMKTNLPKELETRKYLIKYDDIRFNYKKIDKVSIVPAIDEYNGMEVFEPNPLQDSNGNRIVYIYDDLQISSPDLVSWWDFEGDGVYSRGGKSYTRDFANGYDGWIIPNAVVSGVFTGAGDIDLLGGTRKDGIVVDSWNPTTATPDLALDKEVTLNAWVKTNMHTSSGTSWGEARGGAIKRGIDGRYLQRQEYFLGVYENKADLVFGNSDCAVPPSGGSNELKSINNLVSNGQWHMITGILRENGQMEIYVDGKFEGSMSKTIVGIPTGACNHVQLVGATAGTGGFFRGQLDDAMVFKKALNSDQVRIMFEHQKLYHL